MIAGGRGFLGSALAVALGKTGHEVWRLSRERPTSQKDLMWDGVNQGPWIAQLEGLDAVINVTGYSLAHWPWTGGLKKRFVDSRVQPAQALTTAVARLKIPPRLFVQTSGINFYGMTGIEAADETSRPGDDFLARLCIDWESASAGVETAGIRRIITRNAVVLDARTGLLPLMALPVRLFVGGRLGAGSQAMCWVHIEDYVGAVMYLLENPQAQGAYNLVAPMATSSDQFVRSLAAVLHRPYWMPAPESMLGLALGEMSVLITKGRASRPKRLEALGYRFRFPTVDSALGDLFAKR